MPDNRDRRSSRPTAASTRPPLQPMTGSVRPAPGIHATNPVPVRALLAVAGTALGLVLLLTFRTPDDVAFTAGTRLPGGVRPGATSPLTAGGAAIAAGGAGTAAGAAANANPSVVPSTAATASPAGSSAAGASAIAPPGTGTGAAPSASPRRQGGAATLAPTVAPTPAPTAAPSAVANADVKGPVEQTPFGDVQVEVKVQRGQIVDVVALQLPSDRRRSAEISQYVEPILHDETLQAQSAQIDLISGATWTSGAYAASLQGALQQTGIHG